MKFLAYVSASHRGYHISDSSLKTAVATCREWVWL